MEPIAPTIILSPFVLFSNSPKIDPMQAPTNTPIGPIIKNPKNSPIPVPKTPFLELPNFLAVNIGKIKSAKKIRMDIMKVNIRKSDSMIALELK